MQLLLLLDADTRPLKVYAVAGKGSKPEVLPVGSVPADVERSFSGAALATYNFLVRHGETLTCSMLAFEVQEEVAKRIYGRSGGLAFSVAAMVEMLGRKYEKVVGATGIVDPEKGTIEKVEAINEKLRKAMESESGIALILYPLQNSTEVSPDLKRQAKRQGVELKPVRSLQDVYAALFGQSRKSSRRVVRSAIASCLLVGIYIGYALSAQPLALYLLENEQYTAARIHLKVSARLFGYLECVRRIVQEFETPLETEPLFILKSALGREETYPVDRIPNQFLLCDRDAFAFRISPREPLHVYILQTEDARSYRTLYPSNGEAGAITGPVSLPRPGVFYQLQGKPGDRDTFMILSRWRCRGIEKAFATSGQLFRSQADLERHVIPEQSVQLKRIPMTLEKSATQ